jgi:hypothetical protein
MKLTLYSSGVGDQMPAVIELMSNIPGTRLIFSVFSHQPRVNKLHKPRQSSNNRRGHCWQPLYRTEIHFTAMGAITATSWNRESKTLGVSMVSMLRLVPQAEAGPYQTADLRYEDNLQLQQLVVQRSIIRIRPISLRIPAYQRFTMHGGGEPLIVLPDLKISPAMHLGVNPGELWEPIPTPG